MTISAKQARQNVLAFVENKNNIFFQIEEASQKGVNSLRVNDLKADMLKELKDLGFKVKPKLSNDRGVIFEDGFTISW
jgi:hypothetical protein